MGAESLHRIEDGRWLWRRRGRRFLLPDELGRRIAAGDRNRELELLLAERDGRGFSLLRGLRLLPASRVVKLAGILEGATRWPVLIAVATVGALGAAWGRHAPVQGAVDWGLLVVLLAAGGLLHELGHAAALLRGGGRPGDIGCGLMLVVPVLWCDVTEVVLLERADRLRVDFAGPLLHMGAAGAAFVFAGLTEDPTVAAAARAMLLAIVWSLLPLMHTDGAWALADVLDLERLDAPSPLDATPGRRMTAAAVRGLVAVSLTGCALILPLRAASRMGFVFAGPPPCDLMACGLLAWAGIMIVNGTARRVKSLLEGATADLREARAAPR